ncbi:uroporphyrinogen-III synthase [Oryzibacter oryziterrae]|uniref:uroporphyrinogen-III synthase n=1 Tax=Oryzibacter oryziterrae TaxID=2766474 RepID=UPI001F2053DF|nr:uroporphyrinogen-III synthase [Oryzibacter oryziterrae]
MRLLVLRPEPQASALVATLAAHGIDALADPMLDIIPEPDLVRAIAAHPRPDALAFTSANALRALPGGALPAAWLAIPAFCVGEATARAARAAGFADVRASAGTAADLALSLRASGLGHVLHLVGRDQTGDLAAGLCEAGLSAQSLIVYRAEMRDDLAPATWAGLQMRTFAGLIVASQRSAQGFFKILQSKDRLDLLNDLVLIAISEAAAAPLTDRCHRTVIATEPNGDALLRAAVALGSDS